MVTILGEILRLHGILYRKLGIVINGYKSGDFIWARVNPDCRFTLLKPGNRKILIPYNGPSMAIEMVQYLFF